MPAHNGPLSPEVAGEWKANRARHRHRDRTSHFGIRIELNQRSALGVAPEQRQREYENRWRDGGFAMLGAFADLVLNKKANETAAEFVRSKIRAIVNDPHVGPLTESLARFLRRPVVLLDPTCRVLAWADRPAPLLVQQPALEAAMQHALFLTFLGDLLRAHIGERRAIADYCQDWGLTSAQVTQLLKQAAVIHTRLGC